MPREVYNVNWPGWEVVRKIGSGSFGTVYEIQRDVYGDVEKAALKVISIPHNEDEVDYLRCTGLDDASITQTFHQQVGDIAREYKLMAQMRDNPNIVHCEDFRDIQHDDGLGWDIYIKMELLTPLMKCLEKVATEDHVIQMGKDLCNALIACQEKNIIHRDIKPQNIFLSPKGQFKLGDFGIARTMERTTQATAGIGTYSYMAPEVRNNESYGKTADIYSLGLMMYWLLNERRGPFMPLPPAVPKYDDEEKARQRRFSGENMPAPVHGSDEIKRIILKACSYNPEDRYTSAAAMLDDLNKLSGGKEAVSSVVILDDNTDEKREDDKTTGPVFGGIKNEPSKDSVATDPDATVGPTFVVKPPVREPKTETPKAEPIVVKEEKEKKSFLKYIFIALGVLALIVLFILLRSCSENSQAGDPSNGTTGTQATDSSMATPEQLVWSDWVDKLPEGVTADKYEIEEKTLYSSRTQETTSSTTQNTMEGWELYHTANGSGDYGSWTSWSTQKATASESREVETQQQYRYRIKETTTSSAASKNGWELYNTTYALGDYGNWSNWSITAVTPNDSRQVETKKQYSYREKETTTSTNSSLSGWTLYDTTYGAWGNTQTTTTKPTESDTLRITATTQTGWGYYHYCNYYYNGGNNWNVDSIQHGNPSYWHGYTSSIALPAVAFQDQGGQQAYGGTGSGAHHCDYNFYIWFRNPGADTYTYTYETRTKTNHFYKWSDKWSTWSDTSVSSSSDREVKTQTLYRYRDREQIPTYHFWRWGVWSGWSANAVSETSDRDVESATYYRYREKVTETTYYFRKWSDWSEYSEIVATPSETTEVETKTQYRFKSKLP